MIKIIPKVFNIIKYLRQNRRISLKTLSVRTGLAKPTLCNILKEMCALGYVSNDGTGGYALTGEFKKLGDGSATAAQIEQISMDACVRLANATCESAVVTVLHEDCRVRIVTQAQFQRSLMLNVSIYKRLSLYHSVSGRILLAGLSDAELEKLIDTVGLPDETEWRECTGRDILRRELKRIREEKLSLMENPSDEIKSYAVPFADREGQTAGSLGLTVPLFRLTADAERKIYVQLREVADSLSEKNKQNRLTAEDWNNYGN